MKSSEQVLAELYCKKAIKKNINVWEMEKEVLKDRIIFINKQIEKAENKLSLWNKALKIRQKGDMNGKKM